MQSNIRNRTYGNTYTNQSLQMRNNTKKKNHQPDRILRPQIETTSKKSAIFKANKFMSDNLE